MKPPNEDTIIRLIASKENYSRSLSLQDPFYFSKEEEAKRPHLQGGASASHKPSFYKKSLPTTERFLNYDYGVTGEIEIGQETSSLCLVA